MTALAQSGANLEARDNDGCTPLHVAARQGSAEAVMALLAAGADPNARDRSRKTPWDLAQRNSKLKNTGAYRRLASGAAGTSRIEPAPTQPPVQLGMAPEPTPAPAQVDCANWNTAAFFKTARESDVTRCLEAGADPNVRDRSGFTPLHIVASAGNAGAVAALANRGADLGALTRNGETPLHIAAAVENAGVVAALANQGADLEARGRSGSTTPLHRAAALRNDKAVTALLEAGADPDTRTESGQTALHFADTVEVVGALLEAGANPNVQAGNGATPLDYVDNEAVRALLEAAGAFGAGDRKPIAETDELLEARDWRGETALHRVAWTGTAEAATALLQAGADPNARDIICRTPLHMAASLWRSEVGMVLLEAGADPAARDEDGNFPFDEIPAGIGDILRLQAKGMFPPRGQIGGPLQTDFYSKLEQAPV